MAVGDRARFTLEIAEVIAHSALNRKESRGAHTWLDEFKERDDDNYLKHTLAYRTAMGRPVWTTRR